MTSSQKKIFFFLGFFALSFVAFCFFTVRLGMIFSDPKISADFSDYLWPLLFLLLQISGIVFTAIIPSSRFLLLFPIFVSLFIGSVIFDAGLISLFVLGFPLALMFWSVRENINSRIKIQFSVDVRRPITTFFLFFIFFASFVVVPKYQNEVESAVINAMSSFFPTQIQNEDTPNLLLNMSMQDFLQEQINADLVVCKGDSGCEKMLEEKITEEFEKQIRKIPTLSEIDIKGDKPLMGQITKNMMGGGFLEKYKVDFFDMGFVWALFVFLLLSPFSIVFSFFTLIGIRILYHIFRITGFLSVTTKNVQQEIIV